MTTLVVPISIPGSTAGFLRVAKQDNGVSVAVLVRISAAAGSDSVASFHQLKPPNSTARMENTEDTHDQTALARTCYGE